MPAETPWQLILRYIEGREPGFAATIVGASEAELRSLCEVAPAPVPRAVIEMFASIGHASGRFAPLGGNVSTQITPMLEDLDYQCLEGRFFRLAIDPDPEQLGPSHVYIDLLQGDGDDAPLMTLDEGSEGRVPDPRDHGLLSFASRAAFSSFDLARRGVRGYLSARIEDAAISAYAAAFSQLSRRMSLAPIFASQPSKLLASANEQRSLMFDVLGPEMSAGTSASTPPRTHAPLRVWLAAADLDAFHLLSEQVLDNMPPLSTARVWLPDGSVELSALLRARRPLVP